MSRTYITVQGDMWDSVAHLQLGGVAYTDKLMGANRHLLGYFVFPAGVALSLPDVGPDIADSSPPWKGGPR